MFLEAALLGVIIGWLRRGKLVQLGQLPLPGWPLALLALAVQAAIWIDFFTDLEILTAAAAYLHIFSYIPLLIFVFLNRRHRGMFLIGAGILLNLTVISANGGLMPVDPAGLAPALQDELISGTGSPFHAAITEETNLAALGDLIRIPYGKYRVISIGDIFMAAGICLFIQQGMQVSVRQKEK